ncbi:unnamed protein product [Adineta steineri]|uniref:SH2 domain-containing protein n=1 Tax=Adineta steineri TaxID=433720 RepID=A0A813N9D3_9BILA|nr:unnamed protein product [Adineta steineri]
MAAKSTISELSNKDKLSLSGSKSDRDIVHQPARDYTPITCFFKTCDREDSEKLLRESYSSNKQKSGIYMLRQSTRDENKFILSLIKDGQCYHYRAHHAGNGTFLDEKTDSVFYSLDGLLEYYQTDGVRHLRCPLTIPLRGHSLPAFAQRRGITTALHQAASEGQKDVVSQILNDHDCPDIHCKNEEGNTPLHEACFFGRDDVVKELLKAGASWKFVNKLGWTSLHQAALGNCPTVVDILVNRAQADVDARNPFNLYAPIHCAAACNNVETIATLIAHDSPLRPLTENSETPYDLAIKHNGSECIEKLAAARSKPALSRRINYYHGSLTNNVSCLHDKQHIENEEKLEQLRTEISQLRKMLYTTTHDQLIYNDHSRTSSMFGTTHEEHKAKDYEQWTEIEDDAKKLHELIQSQKNQINEIVSLVSQTATASTSLNTTDVSIDNYKDAVADRQTLTTTNTNLISNLLKKIHNITGQQEPTITTTSHETILENHSPGISPTSSMATLTLTSLNQIRDNPPPLPQIEDSSNQQVNNDEPHIPIDIPLPPPPPSPPAVVIEPKKCPICNHEFELTCSDADMYEHIEKCLYSPMANTEPQSYECPNCNRKYPGDDETAYLQHLSDCYNRDIAGDFE